MIIEPNDKQLAILRDVSLARREAILRAEAAIQQYELVVATVVALHDIEPNAKFQFDGTVIHVMPKIEKQDGTS